MNDIVPPRHEDWRRGCFTSVFLHANPVVHLAGAYADPLNWNLKGLHAEFK